MTWYVYDIGIIDDFAWIDDDPSRDVFWTRSKMEQCSIDDIPRKCLNEARKLGWEGDIACGPFRSWLPDPRNLQMVEYFIWKQRNNGSTFVAAPFFLPHLTEEGGECIEILKKLDGASPIEELFFNAWQRETEVELDFQHRVLKYKIDFCFVPKKLAIELDGMVGHSSTEDIEKDRRRQREIEALGYEFVRFGGREVFHNAKECVHEVLRRIGR